MGNIHRTGDCLQQIYSAGSTGLLAVCLSFPVARAAEVGTTAGSFTVTPAGAAAYSIPITVPPGAAGMQPKLSIEYNSQSGNGFLGMGFSLKGLSAISRCPSTLDQDGFIDGVDFDDNDRFCLDGRRLVVESGTYGAVGAEYRTEIESFSRVVTYGGTLGNPDYFRIWTKSGLVMEFGATGNSRWERTCPGKSFCAFALNWAVNKISDASGNYLTVTYDENTANSGESVPLSISYTGNLAGGVTPYNYVAFVYEPRPDVSTAYVGGSKATRSKRLTKVQTHINGAYPGGGSLVREYRFTYVVGESVARSRLATITECAGNEICLPATTLEWQAEGSGWRASQAQGGLHGVGSAGIWLVDINGDGMADYVTKSEDSYIHWNLSTGTGWAANQAQGGLHLVGSAGAWFVDINGDGMADYVTKNNDGNIHWNLSTGTGWAASQSQGGLHGVGAAGIWLVDINGDGMADYVTKSNDGYIHWNLSTGTGWAANQTQGGYISTAMPESGSWTSTATAWPITSPRTATATSTGTCRQAPAGPRTKRKADCMVSAAPE